MFAREEPEQAAEFVRESLCLDNAEDVVVESEDHEHDEEGQPDLLGDIDDLVGNLAAYDNFNKRKKDMAAVEDRNGKEVQDTQIDADEGHEGDEAPEAVLCVLSRKLQDRDRPSELLRGDVPGDHVIDAPYHRFGHRIRHVYGMGDGGDGVFTLPDDVLGYDYPELFSLHHVAQFASFLDHLGGS